MGEARESGRCPGFCLRTGWIDGGAVTKIGNLEGEEEDLWTKKREIQLWTCQVAVAHVSGIHLY